MNLVRSGSGTREWAEVNYNIGKGCAHGCLYCYACHIQLRLKKIKSRNEWLEEKLKPGATGLKKLQAGTIMYPSTHDITPHYLDQSIAVLQQMLSVGNKILIVSKPHLECIRTLLSQLGKYKNQILFRFTIGALDETLTRFWEPQAPPPEERLEALTCTHYAGFNTSVSIEPMLAGAGETMRVVAAVAPFVSETIWIGKMRRLRERADMSQQKIFQAADLILRQQADSEILRLYNHLGPNPKIRWKDSIKKVLLAHHLDVVEMPPSPEHSSICLNRFNDMSHCGLCDFYGVYP